MVIKNANGNSTKHDRSGLYNTQWGIAHCNTSDELYWWTKGGEGYPAKIFSLLENEKNHGRTRKNQDAALTKMQTLKTRAKSQNNGKQDKMEK